MFPGIKTMEKEIDYSVYLVTDKDCLQGRELLDCVEQALRGGVTLVQYRSKSGDSLSMYREALALKRLCDKFEVPLIINDRLDIALAVGAAGLHVGQEDLPCAVVRRLVGKDFLIGVSVHDVKEAQQALQDGADYLGCGAVFSTQTKLDVDVMGLELLRKIRSSVSLPCVGIGGISPDNYAQVLATGVEGAAMVSAILGAEDIESQVRKFLALRP